MDKKEVEIRIGFLFHINDKEQITITSRSKKGDKKDYLRWNEEYELSDKFLAIEYPMGIVKVDLKSIKSIE